MEFRVLGPLEVRRQGRAIEVHGSRRRAVLALLVLQANEVVRTDRLIEDLWGDNQPANASAALHSHVSRLRKDLGTDVLVTKPWGYVLRVAPEAIDLRRFESIVAEARPLAAHERNAKLAEALALWRGPALADLAQEPALEAERARIDELRQSVVEQQIDARLELGEDAEVVRELEELVSEHPLRERLRGQLILAMYRSGRQAEALETYRETRRVLVEELGIEPSPELRELERAILRQDPALASVRVPSEPGPPRQKPPSSRWRWPRSPLVVGAALLLLLAGAAIAILATPRSGTPHASGARPPSLSVRTVTSRSTSNAATNKNHGTSSSFDRKRSARPRGQSTQPRTQHQVTAAASSSKNATTTTTAEPQMNKPHPLPPPPPPPPVPPPPPPPPPPARPLVRMADDFDDGVVASDIWQPLLTGTGTAVSEQNRRLELSFTADAAAAPNGQGFTMMAAQVGTACRFLGDFDARVSYELVNWPPANGVILQLAAWFRSSSAAVVRQSQRLGIETYAGWHGSTSASVGTSDRRGTLRLRRQGSQLASLVRHGRRWVRIVSSRASGAPMIGLQVMSTDEWFADQPVTVAFDDFEIKAGQPVC